MATPYIKTDQNTYKVEIISVPPGLMPRLEDMEICSIAKAIAPFVSQCFVGEYPPRLDICVSIGVVAEDMVRARVAFEVMGLGRCNTRKLIQSLESAQGQLLEAVFQSDSANSIVNSTGEIAFLLPLKFLVPEGHFLSRLPSSY